MNRAAPRDLPLPASRGNTPPWCSSSSSVSRSAVVTGPATRPRGCFRSPGPPACQLASHGCTARGDRAHAPRGRRSRRCTSRSIHIAMFGAVTASTAPAAVTPSFSWTSASTVYSTGRNLCSDLTLGLRRGRSTPVPADSRARGAAVLGSAVRRESADHSAWDWSGLHRAIVPPGRDPGPAGSHGPIREVP